LIASYDDEMEGWHDVFQANVDYVNKTLQDGSEYDLVLYGDSIIERMNGMVFGQPAPAIKDQIKVTQELLTKKGGGRINAFPLGIAGDEVCIVLPCDRMCIFRFLLAAVLFLRVCRILIPSTNSDQHNIFRFIPSCFG